MKKKKELLDKYGKISRYGLVLMVLMAMNIIPVVATPFNVGPLVLVTGPSPFTSSCNDAPNQSGIVYPNSEVEPWVAVNPANLNSNIIGVWQQDRWSNGGSNGLLTGVSHNGGLTWSKTMAHFSVCSGGDASNGGNYQRASDPWVTFSPNGNAYQIALSFNDSDTANAILVSKSTDKGDTWREPIILKKDINPTILNDKESITSDPDPTNSNVYAVWDRLVFPSPQASAAAVEHSLAFRGPVWFSRTTDGENWEQARIIFDPGQNAQTIGNQIVVLPNGDLVDIFDLIYAIKNAKGVRGYNIAVIRSIDKGVKWSKPIIVNKLNFVAVLDPDNGQYVRTGDNMPEIGVDKNNGNLYAVWQDGRFDTGFSHVAFSMSTDGGLTWSVPINIDKTPAGKSAFTPSISVLPDGTVGVTYYDFRKNDPGIGLPTDYWIVHCHNSCDNPSNWEENHVDGSFDMETAPIARGFFVGDYESLSTIGGRFLPFFVKTNSGNTNDRTDVLATTVGP